MTLRHLLAFSLLALAFAAPAAEKPANVPFADSPHDYWTRSVADVASELVVKLGRGEVALDQSDEKSFLLGVLKALEIPVSSQLLVYSATSLQSGLIHPSNPRALYFSEEAYVGFVPGGRIEIVAIDPAAGPVFQILSRTGGGRPPFVDRSSRCMNCHAGNPMHQRPGFFTESVLATNTGGSLDGFRRDLVGHTVPLKDRFGGWHVTDAGGPDLPLANLMAAAVNGKVIRIKNPPGSQFDWERYPVQSSKLMTHLIHEHQLEFHNLVTMAVYEAREALAAGGGKVDNADALVLNDVARQLVRYLLFAKEAELPSGGVPLAAEFAADFLARKHATKDGRSLRDLDLRTRIFKYRCSYMIYTPSFVAMPPVVKDRVLAGLRTALSDVGLPEFSYLPLSERRAIREILRETLPGGF